MKVIEYNDIEVAIIFDNKKLIIKRNCNDYNELLQIIKDTDIYTCLEKQVGSLYGSICNIDSINLLKPFFNKKLRIKKLIRLHK